MSILFIDTALRQCIVALKCGDSFFFRILSQENQHASNLNILIDEVLNEAKISYSDLSIVVVTVGPGSFTGIRVGMSAAYAINAVYDTAIYGISTLEIFAYIKECNSIVSSEAGRDRFYIQHFSSDKVPSSPIQLFHKDELNNYNSSIAGAYIGESYNAHDILKAFHYKLKNFPVVTQLPSPIYINNAIYWYTDKGDHTFLPLYFIEI